MIIADHPIMRDSLRRLFRRQADIDLVGELHAAREALTELRRCHPDILLIDLQIPPGEAKHAIRCVRAVSPLAPIIVLTTYPWESVNFYPGDPGTLVLVSKTAPGDEVLAAVRQAATR